MMCHTLYARYTFSYRLDAAGSWRGARSRASRRDAATTRSQRIMVAIPVSAFVDLNFAPERIAKIVAKVGTRGGFGWRWRGISRGEV